MDSQFWLRVHGGSTHFPIVLLAVSVLFDLLGICWPDKSARRGLHIAGLCAALIAVLASFAAVASGLIIGRWRLLGTGSMLQHHIFVWPGFGFSIALIVWRLIMRDRASARAFGVYVVGMAGASALILIAAYFGGEMALAGNSGQ
jgi:uncharacterized membrane protein